MLSRFAHDIGWFAPFVIAIWLVSLAVSSPRWSRTPARSTTLYFKPVFSLSIGMYDTVFPERTILPTTCGVT